MKQVQLKIEEFFKDSLLYQIKIPSTDKIGIQIKEKIETRLIDGRFLKPNESRETIIEALWEYNKSLIKKFNDEIEKKEGSNSNNFRYINRIRFYNPDTRVITITDFREGL